MQIERGLCMTFGNKFMDLLYGRDGDRALISSFFGFGLIQTWATMLYKTAIVFPLSVSPAIAPTGFRIASYAIQAVTMLFLFVYIQKREALASSIERLCIIGCSLGPIGALVLYASSFLAGAASATLSCLGWAMSAIAMGALYLLWIWLFSGTRTRALCMYLSGSMLLGACITLLLCNVPTLLAVLATALLPMVSGICVLRSNMRKDEIENSESVEDSSEPIIEDNRSFSSIIKTLPWRILIIILIYALIDNALIAPIETRRGAGLENQNWILILASAIVGLVFFVLSWFTTKRSPFVRIFKVTLPIIAISLIIFPFAHNISFDLAAFIGILAYETFVLTSWIVVSLSARYNSTSIFAAFIFARISLDIGALLGMSGSAYMTMFNLYRDKDLFTVLCLTSVIVIVFIAITPLNGRNSPLFEHPENEGGRNSLSGMESSGALVQIPSSEEIFQAKANRIIERYRLTPREAEVFIFLAKGRSNKLIQERLVISPHTVDSHITHIYRKCGVHSRQEIMDFLEQEHVEVRNIPQHK